MDPTNAGLPPGAPVSAMNFPAIDEVFGCMLIGVFLNCILFGIMVMQAFIYYQSYPADRKWLKLFVAYLCLAETANTACNMYVVYEPLITRFGQIEAIELFPKLLSSQAIVTVLISTPVQIFMAWRISVITGTLLITLVICLFSLMSFAGGVWLFATVIILKIFANKDTFQFNLPGVFWFVSSAIADILITVTLVYTLSRRRKVGQAFGYTTITTSAINRIIRLTIQTGLITMVFALVDLLLFTLDSKTAISFVFDFSISKLYTNALLSSLNARAGWNKLNIGDNDNVLFGTSSAVLFTHGTQTAGTHSTFTTGSQIGTQKDNYAGKVAINVDTQVHTYHGSIEEGQDYPKGNAV
ncbi:hypothetical protein L218DRAFT_159551 [Marasmius fiardii PR-910]|nr:hypothetical protein L218DRAFT_159551 [Marasmius fiardii PR-910]